MHSGNALAEKLQNVMAVTEAFVGSSTVNFTKGILSVQQC
jgi:hypothetical protein